MPHPPTLVPARQMRGGTFTREMWQRRLTELMLEGGLSEDQLQKGVYFGVYTLRKDGATAEELHEKGLSIGALAAGGYTAAELEEVSPVMSSWC